MSWDLTGLYVEGMYMGAIAVQGKVESSRVKYGGEVQHTIVLDNIIDVYGSMRDRVLVEHKYITRVYSNPAEVSSWDNTEYDDRYELDTDYN